MTHRFLALFACFTISMTSLVYSAEINWRKAVFIPASLGAEPKVLELDTGALLAVLKAQGGVRPIKCPPDAFWMPKYDQLITCEGFKAYGLEKHKDGVLAAKGYFALVPIGDPGPGDTDDPGPSVKP